MTSTEQKIAAQILYLEDNHTTGPDSLRVTRLPAADKGGEIVNCDVTVICERPKLTAYRESMRAKVAEILAIGVERVSVKGTTTEGLGFTGRREGIAAEAVATVRLP